MAECVTCDETGTLYGKANMVHDSDGYIGHKVMALVIGTAPLVFNVDNGDLFDRFFLAICGTAGSVIAIISDRPSGWKDTAGRMGSGFLVCALFGPWLCRRYNLADSVDSSIALAAVLGIISWYVAGSSVRTLQWVKTSGVVGDFIRMRVGLPQEKSPDIPALKPDVSQPKQGEG